MKIRKAEIGDEQKIAEKFWHTLGKEMEDYHSANELKESAEEEAVEKFGERIEDEKYSFYFLMEDGEEIGYISLEKSQRASWKLDKYVEILGVYVKKDFRDQGHGTKLIEKAGEVAKDLEADYMTVSAEWENKGARKFYQENGFDQKQVKFITEIKWRNFIEPIFKIPLRNSNPWTCGK